MGREEQIEEMNKEQQIEEIANIIFDTLKKTFNATFKDVAKALYLAGYHKTFTSDFASDTQKAYKEGYEKGIETKAEMERLKAQLSEFEKPVTQFVKDRAAKAVKEFARKLKDKAIDFSYSATVDGHTGFDIHISELCHMIDELLKEYEQCEQ